MNSLRQLAVSSAVMAAVACGSSSPPTSPSPVPSADGASSVTIPMGAEGLGSRAFNPAEVSVAVGATVSWVNADSVAHTSTSDSIGWNSGAIAPGRQFSATFPTAGTFPYHCAIHPGMVGSVIVR